MADARNVCCMCGDIGFPDKLFQCLRCLYRFQHSYCSNYYYEESSTDPIPGVCDWCKSEEQRAHSRRLSTAGTKAVRQGSDRDDSSARGSRGRSSGAGPPSPSSSSAKPSGRRYKLLKDVMC